MNKRLIIPIALLFALLGISSSQGAYSNSLLAPAAPLGPEFIYQGLFKDANGAPIVEIISFQPGLPILTPAC